MTPSVNSIIGLPGYELISCSGTTPIRMEVRLTGPAICPWCEESKRLRLKESILRQLRHSCQGLKNTVLLVKAAKYHCRTCRKYFHQRLPGVLPYQRSTEPFRQEVAVKHHMGHSKSQLGQFLKLSASTVERYYRHHLGRQAQESKNASCPKIIGIDEKYFTKKRGFMTSLADLGRHKIFDLTLGRSEQSLSGFLLKIPGRDQCKVVVMDLSETYRSIARKYFPNALIVADRFHVIKLVNHHFLKTWALLDEQGRKNRGLVSLIRRHEWNLNAAKGQPERLRHYLKSKPALEVIYDVKQILVKLLLTRVSSKSQARPYVQQFVHVIAQLKSSGFASLETLGQTLESWSEEIVRMWRFSKTNSILEGLHTRYEEILRRAYGMRNFDNFRLRVKAFCG